MFMNFTCLRLQKKTNHKVGRRITSVEDVTMTTLWHEEIVKDH